MQLKYSILHEYFILFGCAGFSLPNANAKAVGLQQVVVLFFSFFVWS
jgi:hypothetical protein